MHTDKRTSSGAKPALQLCVWIPTLPLLRLKAACNGAVALRTPFCGKAVAHLAPDDCEAEISLCMFVCR